MARVRHDCSAGGIDACAHKYVKCALGAVPAAQLDTPPYGGDVRVAPLLLLPYARSKSSKLLS